MKFSLSHVQFRWMFFTNFRMLSHTNTSIFDWRCFLFFYDKKNRKSFFLNSQLPFARRVAHKVYLSLNEQFVFFFLLSSLRVNTQKSFQCSDSFPYWCYLLNNSDGWHFQRFSDEMKNSTNDLILKPLSFIN